MVDVQTIGVVVTAVSVSVAAIYYIMTLRVQQANMKATLETRQTQILMSLYQKWSEPEFQDAFYNITSWEWKDYDDYDAKYGRKANPSAFRKRSIIGVFFEGLGVLVKRGFIDAALVDDLLSSYIIIYWQKFAPILLEFRRRMNVPSAFEHTEYLYDAVYRIWLEQHPEVAKPSPQ